MATTMRDLRWGWLLAVLAALPFVPLPGSAAGSDGPQRTAAERVEQGRRLYGMYCATCHGRTGRGDGPMAVDLRGKPADLTRLAASHGGTFPRARAYQAIDGRLAVRGHGSSEMPVWGIAFQTAGSDHEQEREVRERIEELLSYLETIQR